MSRILVCLFLAVLIFSMIPNRCFSQRAMTFIIDGAVSGPRYIDGDYEFYTVNYVFVPITEGAVLVEYEVWDDDGWFRVGDDKLIIGTNAYVRVGGASPLGEVLSTSFDF